MTVIDMNGKKSWVNLVFVLVAI